VFTGLHPEKRAHPPDPIFGPCLSWPNGWMDESAIVGMKVNVGPGDVVLDGVAAPSKRAQPLSFWFMSIVAKRTVRKQTSAQATMH